MPQGTRSSDEPLDAARREADATEASGGTASATSEEHPADVGMEEQRPSTDSVRRLELWDREGLAPTTFALLFVLATAALLYVFGPFVHDIVLAFVVVGLFGPLYRRVLPRMRNPWACSALVTCLALVLVAGPVVWLSLTVFQEATSAYDGFNQQLGNESVVAHISRLMHRLGVPVSEAQVMRYADSYATRLSEFALDQGGRLVNNLVTGLLHLCVIVVLVFYTLVDGSRLKSFLLKLSPLPDEQDELIVRKFTLVARSVLVGNGVGSALQGIVGGVAMAVVGLPSPVLWGSVMTIAAFLPLLGVSIVVVPAGIYLMLKGEMAEGVTFIIVCMSVSLVIENVLKTKLMGYGVHVHDVPLFLGILGGLAGFGLLGLLYGPLIVAMFLALTDLYMTHYRPQFAARFASRKRRGSVV